MPPSRGGGAEIASGRENMPLIEIHLLEGRTEEQKKALLTAISKAVHESIGAPVESIRIWIEEFTPKDYMAAGVWYGDRKK
jgi:4-oxalocrotonate tautomerase